MGCPSDSYNGTINSIEDYEECTEEINQKYEYSDDQEENSGDCDLSYSKTLPNAFNNLQTTIGNKEKDQELSSELLSNDDKSLIEEELSDNCSEDQNSQSVQEEANEISEEDTLDVFDFGEQSLEKCELEKNKALEYNSNNEIVDDEYNPFKNTQSTYQRQELIQDKSLSYSQFDKACSELTEKIPVISPSLEEEKSIKISNESTVFFYPDSSMKSDSFITVCPVPTDSYKEYQVMTKTMHPYLVNMKNKLNASVSSNRSPSSFMSMALQQEVEVRESVLQGLMN